MRETPIATGAEHLALDVCKPCQLLWFDATELAQFSPARQAPPPRTDRLSPDAAEALFLAEAEGRETLELAEEQAAAISAVACAALGSNLFSLVLLKRLAERRT